MNTYRLAMIGFGNVGQGLAQILRDRGDDIAQRHGARFQIVAVSDLLKGSVYDPDGLAAEQLLQAVGNDGDLSNVPAPHRGWDALRTIEESNADVILEMSYTDLETGEPALTHVRRALRQGRHVVTTNKGPTALHFPELKQLAHENNVEIGVEGTVMSGTPALRLGMELLSAAGVQRVQGILNGTTNYILTQMEAGATYEEALAEAQEKGYAEADPTGDVEGHDAAGKVVILANLLMDLPLTMSAVAAEGITGLTPQAIAEAAQAGERWKLIGLVEKQGDDFTASVRPTRLPLAHPLASVGGATNAITYTTDLLGEVTLVGPGAGRVETGYALLGDMLAIHRRRD
ncbi:MAG TPA: homoserine dehydrogenase [Candidatus Sulfomarinibacteraceae bacterium]|nr:homoserine dehydrogenase [Candidatus Sulfomarinibacteraceae bacterium]